MHVVKNNDKQEKSSKKNKIKVKSNLVLTGTNNVFMEGLLPNHFVYNTQSTDSVYMNASNSQQLPTSNILPEFPENSNNCDEQIDLTQ